MFTSDNVKQHIMSDFSKWENETPFNCKEIANKTNIITNAYNGIPETFILNVISWILLVLIFSILRHQAVDFHRLALIIHDGKKKRWTEVFYARCSKTTLSTYPKSSARNSQCSHNLNSRESTTCNNEDGLFAWILRTWKLKKEEILLHTGPDAVHYLSFQLHLMIVMTIVTLVSIFIILPVNFFNSPINDEFSANSFGRTTMANLSSDSIWLWVHVIVAILYAPLITLVMRKASGRNAFKKAATRTIMISDIGLNDRNPTVIRNYLQELFPEISIEDVQIAYNISKLHARFVEYEKMHQARLFCEQHREREFLKVRPDKYSCRKISAFDFYQHEERILAGDVARLRAASLNEPLGIAFITVSTVLEAQNIIKCFNSLSHKRWILTFAPSPDDIFWENLNVSKSHWYITWVAVNFVLFIVLFFITTPIMVVNFLNVYALEKYNIDTISPLISEFLPTLLLWTLTSLMPVIVAFSDKWLSHYTRSLQNYSIMTKCFGFLLFMIFILPSLGFSSAQAFLDWSVSNDTKRWQCFFLPDRGSFYVNYIITAAFIGTSLELLRFPELCVYIWMLFKARSEAETPFIRKSILIEFPFGIHYAWTVLIFTISIVYSVFCPLIMPFAMIYICLKHFVDRHNLYFVYGPSNMISRSGGKIHSTAVTMTKFAVILLLTIMAMISYVRGLGMIRAIVTLCALIVVVILFIFMSPIKRCASVRRPSLIDIAGPTPTYIADVLNMHKIMPPHEAEVSVNPITSNMDHFYNAEIASNVEATSDYSVNSLNIE